MLSIGKHGAPNTSSGQGAARRELGTPCSDSVDGQNKGVSRTSFTSSSWCGTCQAPCSTCQCQFYCRQKRRDVVCRRKLRGGQHVAVSVCACVCIGVCVCQFSQLTATVAEPRCTLHSARCTHSTTLDSINCSCQMGDRECKCNCSCKCPAHYCN